MQYIDQPAARFRREFREALHRQRVSIRTRTISSPQPRDHAVETRAQRAHRRRTRHERESRNALPPGTSRFVITLHGIWPRLASVLGIADGIEYRTKSSVVAEQLPLLD
jgi:hypothetical protein